MNAADFAAHARALLSDVQSFAATLSPRDQAMLAIGMRACHIEEALASGQLDRAKTHVELLVQHVDALKRGVAPTLGAAAVGLGSLDFPAMGQALWALYDKGGPRPEYVLPVLYSESGFNPAIVNSIGCEGINQACPFAFQLPADYTSWSASQQMNGMVTPMYMAIVKKFGPLRSGTRAYQANFLPATLSTATQLSSVLATQGGAVYSANAGFDYQHKGTITVGDLAHFIGKAASASAVQSAIAQTYALRPSESPNDPVYGEDFGAGAGGTQILELVAYGTAILGGAALLALGLRRWKLNHYARARRNPTPDRPIGRYYEIRGIGGHVELRTASRRRAYAELPKIAGERLPWGKSGYYIRGATFLYQMPGSILLARADWDAKRQGIVLSAP